jgi:hypothetical protein
MWELYKLNTVSGRTKSYVTNRCLFDPQYADAHIHITSLIRKIAFRASTCGVATSTAMVIMIVLAFVDMGGKLFG